MSSVEQRLSLVTFGDLERARRFYEALDWTTDAAAGDDVVFFQAGGMILALWDRGKLAEDTARRSLSSSDASLELDPLIPRRSLPA